jgi:hypothetical protein
MNVKFTIPSSYSGTLADDFNISGTTSGNVTSELASGITLTQLLAGYTITDIDDTITGGTVCSTGVCTNCYPWGAPSATPTPTPTPTTNPDPYSVVGSTSVSASISTANNPVTGTTTGTITVNASSVGFKVSAQNQFNYDNSVGGELTINGTTITVGPTTGSGTFLSAATITLTPGTYAYTLKVTGSLGGGLTTGAVTASMVNVS